MTHTRSTTRLIIVTLGAVMCSMMIMATPAHAATKTAEGPDVYLALKAKVAYLEAVLASLQAGQSLDVIPTFVTGMRANVVTLSGTLSRPTSTDMVEICGPMQKGTIEWGDGTVTGVAGLGCAGDVVEFESVHTYTKTGAYTITLHDMEQRVTTRNIAIVVP